MSRYNSNLAQNTQNTEDNCAAEAAYYVKRTFTSNPKNGYNPRPQRDISDIRTQKQWNYYLESWIQYASDRMPFVKSFETKNFIEKRTLLTQLFLEYCRVTRILNEQSGSVSCNIHLYRFARIVILISFLIHEMVPDSETNMGKYLDDVKKERIKQLEQIEIIQNEINQCMRSKSMKFYSMKTDAETNAEKELRRICENANANFSETTNSLSNSNIDAVENANDYHASQPRGREYVGNRYKFSSRANHSKRSAELANRLIRSSIRHNVRHSVRPNVQPNPSNVPRTVRSRVLNRISKTFKLPEPPVSNEPVTPRKFVNRARAFSNRVRGWFGYRPRYPTLKKHRFF